jgi:hypothetical protein
MRPSATGSFQVANSRRWVRSADNNFASASSMWRSRLSPQQKVDPDTFEDTDEAEPHDEGHPMVGGYREIDTAKNDA